MIEKLTSKNQPNVAFEREWLLLYFI